MDISITNNYGKTYARMSDAAFRLEDVQTTVELLMNCSYQGADILILDQNQLHPDFFDLKTGIAGEILQKFSTYQFKMGVIGDFSSYTSKALRDFIYESNQQGRIVFTLNEEDACKLLD